MNSISIYHVNSRSEIEKCKKSFESNNPHLYTAKEDGFWAGNGMYFWDNIGNANYWLKHSRKKDPIILKAKLNYSSSDILDLTDNTVMNTFNELWPAVAKKFKINEKATLGKKINTLTEFFGTKVKVVKEIGLYPRVKNHEFLNVNSGQIKLPHVTGQARIIYCVKTTAVLSNLQIINNEV